MTDTVIRIRYSTIDHFSETRTFKTLKGARRYAKRRMGTMFDIGSGYAVDMFGTGKITVSGTDLYTLLDVTPPDPEPSPVSPFIPTKRFETVWYGDY